MKYFAVILALFVVGAYTSTLTDEQKAKLKALKESCITETGVDAAVVDAVQKGGAPARGEKEDCFSACFLKKIGVMKEDGSIDQDAIRAKAAETNVDKAKVEEVIDACKGLAGKDACETGGNIFACFLTKKTFPVLD